MEAEKGMLETVPEQPAVNEQEAAQRKQHKRRVRALRSFLIRTVLLAAVVYILFFHIVGLMMMPNRDMYPRLDTGDLLLYYRLEDQPKAQDLVVIDKAAENGEKAERFVCRVEYPVKLGDGEYFVLADRRNGGMDSRYFGVVKAEEIRGVVITVLRRNNL